MFDCPQCGLQGGLKRGFNTSVALTIPEHMTAHGEQRMARYRQWAQSPEVKAKLKSGEFDVARKSSDVNQV